MVTVAASKTAIGVSNTPSPAMFIAIISAMDRKEYMRKYQLEWMRKRRAQWFNENGPCRFCGSWEDLELDHINPEQKITHLVWSMAKERREAELAKCRPLCHVCHQKRHGAGGQQHGTTGMYRKHGCRCQPCVSANTESCNRYRESLKARGLKRKA